MVTLAIGYGFVAIVPEVTHAVTILMQFRHHNIQQVHTHTSLFAYRSFLYSLACYTNLPTANEYTCPIALSTLHRLWCENVADKWLALAYRDYVSTHLWIIFLA